MLQAVLIDVPAIETASIDLDDMTPFGTRPRRGESRSVACYDHTTLGGSIVDELLEALSSDPRLASAILFGSAARGGLRPDSDIDVAVLAMDVDAQASLEADLLETLGALGGVARRDVHLIALDRADPELRRSIFAEGRVLFDRSGGRLRELEARTLIEYFDGEYLRRIVDEGHRRRLEQALG